MTYLHGKTLGVRIIEAPTVLFVLKLLRLVYIWFMSLKTILVHSTYFQSFEIGLVFTSYCGNIYIEKQTKILFIFEKSKQSIVQLISSEIF